MVADSRWRHRRPRPVAHAAIVRAGGVACLIASIFCVVGCGRTVRPPVEDMALAFAARTALVNDATVGAAPIEVHAQAGVVTLDGRVATDAERARVVALVRAVPGVRRVESRITVSAAPAAEPVAEEELQPGRSALPPDDPWPPSRHFAAGVGGGFPAMRDGTLEGVAAFGPVLRFGRGAGWRPAFTLAGLRAELPPASGTSSFGDLRTTVIGVGLGYALTGARWSLTPAAVAGYGFNHIRLDPGSAVPTETSLPVAVDGSLVVLPSAAVWYEASRRVSVGVSLGYLISRPEATWLQGERFERRRLKADAVLVSVGVAYWVF